MERVTWTKEQSEKYENEVRAIQRDITQEQAEADELKEKYDEGAFAKSEAIAINALKKGFDLSLIKELTGLSLDQIEDLHKKMKK